MTSTGSQKRVYRILWIDDELKDWESSLRERFDRLSKLRLNEHYGHEIYLDAVDKPEEFLARLTTQDNRYDFLIVDLQLHETDPDLGKEHGLKLLDRLQLLPNIPPRLLLTGKAGLLRPQQAVALGITEYYKKNILIGDKFDKNFRATFESLLDLPSRYDYCTLEKHERLTIPPRLRARLEDEIAGRSLEMLKLRASIISAARSPGPVLITGPTGSGKELVARQLHEISKHFNHVKGDWVTANCAAFTPDLLMSELFGHLAGSFTGAIDNREGLVKQANGTTLFLDEVGFADRRLQRALLRTLSTGKVRPVGATAAEEEDVAIGRLVAATDQPVWEDQELERGFFYRLAGTRISVPPLSARASDISDAEKDDEMDLPANLLSKLIRKNDDVRKVTFTPSAIAELQMHSWPGNVRELEHVISAAINEQPRSPSNIYEIDAAQIRWHLRSSSVTASVASQREGDRWERFLTDGPSYKSVERRVLAEYVHYMFVQVTGGRTTNDAYSELADVLQCSPSTIKARLKDYRELSRDMDSGNQDVYS